MRNIQAAQKRVDEDSSFPLVPQQGRVTVMKGDGINTVVSLISDEVQNKKCELQLMFLTQPSPRMTLIIPTETSSTPIRTGTNPIITLLVAISIVIVTMLSIWFDYGIQSPRSTSIPIPIVIIQYLKLFFSSRLSSRYITGCGVFI